MTGGWDFENRRKLSLRPLRLLIRYCLGSWRHNSLQPQVAPEVALMPRLCEALNQAPARDFFSENG